MLDKKNMIYLAAGAAAVYAYFSWQKGRSYRPPSRPMSGVGGAPMYAPGLPAPNAPQSMPHPRQHGLMQAVAAPGHARPIPPAGPHAPPADHGGGSGGVPTSHDAVQLAPSAHMTGSLNVPPPPEVINTGENFFEIAQGIGPVELQGF